MNTDLQLHSYTQRVLLVYNCFQSLSPTPDASSHKKSRNERTQVAAEMSLSMYLKCDCI